MTLQIISAEEIIQFHDRLLRVTPGVAGMPDPGRAEAIMYRVLNKIEYEGVTDVWRLAAMHLLAISRGHIFNDGNKRTALFITLLFKAKWNYIAGESRLRRHDRRGCSGATYPGTDCRALARMTALQPGGASLCCSPGEPGSRSHNYYPCLSSHFTSPVLSSACHLSDPLLSFL
jgi:death-on-curing protein